MYPTKISACFRFILGEQRQQQSRIPPIMFLFACFLLCGFSPDDRRGIRSPTLHISSRNHCVEPVVGMRMFVLKLHTDEGQYIKERLLPQECRKFDLAKFDCTCKP
jgi:hypothetical protein